MPKKPYWTVEVGVAMKPLQGEGFGRWALHEIEILPGEDVIYADAAAEAGRLAAIMRCDMDLIEHSWVISVQNHPKSGDGLKATNGGRYR